MASMFSFFTPGMTALVLLGSALLCLLPSVAGSTVVVVVVAAAAPGNGSPPLPFLWTVSNRAFNTSISSVFSRSSIFSTRILMLTILRISDRAVSSTTVMFLPRCSVMSLTEHSSSSSGSSSRKSPSALLAAPGGSMKAAESSGVRLVSAKLWFLLRLIVASPASGWLHGTHDPRRTETPGATGAGERAAVTGRVSGGGAGHLGTSVMDAVSVKGTVSTCEENVPAALPVLLDVVRGPERLPADDQLKEILRGKLRVLQVDSTKVNALFMELSAHLISINSEEKVIYIRFRTFEEIWKFTTYYTIGFLGQCMESLLLDQTFWLSSVEDDISIEVSIQEETLSLMYKRILMQDGSLFASCTANQMFDSSTSGGDLYLEQGDIAQFEPPSWAQVGLSSPWLMEAEELLPDQLWNRSLLFTSKKEATGEVGLVKMSLVQPSTETYEWV
ncbi:hypothetical protein INR49_011553 [Caranx melampygus]|nr:hypothetical protein INR49_011553 [Caranx melampygus]